MEKEKLANAINNKNKQKQKISRKKSTNKDRSAVALEDDVATGLPPPFRSKLQNLFCQIEKEFERMHNQNTSCKHCNYHVENFFCINYCTLIY